MPSAFARWLPVSALLSLVPLGCANPGQPRPPSLHIPAPATGLRAQRVGPAVHLTWITPDETTDKQLLRGPILAAICRDHQPVRIPPDCHRVSSFAVSPGVSSTDDPLPSALVTGPATLLVYRVQLFNEAGRSAAPSPPAYSAAGMAPAPLGPVTVTATRQGATLTWEAGPDDSPVELRRILISPPVRPVLVRPGQSTPAPRQPTAAKHQPDVVTLRANAGSAGEQNGLLDPGVRPTETYHYVAQRVRTVSLSIPSGGNISIDLRGLPSPAVAFTDHDVFPPRTPSGLAGIASPGDPAAAVAPSVDLSWEPGLEPDLLGYNLYRADGPQAPFRRVNPSPLPGPAFHDAGVSPDHSYLYRVTAVDRTGNESPPSPPVSETVPRP